MSRYCRKVAAQAKRNLVGDDTTLPDLPKLAMLLALTSANTDMSTPVMYTALLETTFHCDLFTIFGVFYGISQANLVQPIICGWLADYWGRHSHIVILVCGLALSVAQAATLVTTNVWWLGAIFLFRTFFLNQALDQVLKLFSTRANKMFPDDDDKREIEIQRVGAMSDFWTSIIEASTYAVAYALPPLISRYVLVGSAVACTFAISCMALTYTRKDLTLRTDAGGEGTGLLGDDQVSPDRRRSRSRAGSAAAAVKPLSCAQSWCSCAPGSHPRGFLGYILSVRHFFTNPLIGWPLFHYTVLQLFSVMVTLPLTQNQAAGLPTNAPGQCDGLMSNLYLQMLFNQAFFLVGSVLYVIFLAEMLPRAFFRYGFPALGIVMLGASGAFYYQGLNVYWSTIVISVLSSLSYYCIEYDNWYLMSVVDESLYGYFMVLTGLAIAGTGAVASAFMTLDLSNAVVLLTAQITGGVGIATSLIFGCCFGKRLHAVDSLLHDGGSAEAEDSDSGTSVTSSSEREFPVGDRL